jgi:hypothetical protein
MGTLYVIGFLVLFFGMIMVFMSGDKDILVKIKAKSGKIYTAKKNKKSKNHNFLDWWYYDENGKDIEDEELKKLIYEAFYDEDWYGDYEFTINDIHFLDNIPTPQEILGGESRPHVELREKEEKENKVESNK